MPRSKKNQTVEINVGDRVVIKGRRSIASQEGTVAEVDLEKNSVRLTEWGWLPMGAVEVLDETSSKPQTLNGTVDGKDAQIVLDGKTGGPLDGEAPLVKPPIEDLVKSLSSAHAKLGEMTLAKKKASEAHKDAQGAVNAVVAEIVNFYGHPDQLGLELPTAATSDDDDEEEEDDDEQLAPTGKGALSYSGPE